MKFLGIDYGEKRIGIAVSDDGGMIAFPHVTIENTSSRFQRSKKYAMPKSQCISLSGCRCSSARCRRSCGRLSDLARRLRDSRRSRWRMKTKCLRRKWPSAMARKNTVDQSSAALILQSYLDRQKGYSIIESPTTTWKKKFFIGRDSCI